MVRLYWKAIVWNIFVIVASLMPKNDIPDLNLILIPHLDKVIHFIMYAVLTVLILQKNRIFFDKKIQNRSLLFTVLYSCFTGFFLEIMQNSFIIGRFFDIFDILANITGTIFAVLFFKVINH